MTDIDIDAIRQQVERYTGFAGSSQRALAHRLAKQVPALLAELAEANAEVRSVTNQLTHTVNDLAQARNQAHRDATNHQQIVRANTELAGERDGLKRQRDEDLAELRHVGRVLTDWRRAFTEEPEHEADRVLVDLIDAGLVPTAVTA